MRRRPTKRPQPRLLERREPQLALPLPDEIPQESEAAVHWRLCRTCGRPIHPDAPRCGWCPKPLRKQSRAEESPGLF